MSTQQRARLAALTAILAFGFAAPALADAMPHPEAQQSVLHKAKGLHPAARMTVAPTGCNGAGQPFCDAMMTPTPGWTGNVFKLSQDYPAKAPEDK